jgi:hypothetical protein
MSQYPLHLYSTFFAITAPLSLLGSSAMLYVISRSKDKLSTTLNRLLVGLCVADIIFSFPMLFSKLIIKLEDRELIDADGVIDSYSVPGTTNWAACRTQGFFIYVGGHVSVCYNICLCIYYVCVIKLNYSNTKIKKKIEPFLHAIPWSYAITTVIGALATKSINPGDGFCFNYEYRPQDCYSDDCVRGLHAWIFDLADIIILYVTFIVIILMMTIIYLKVWRQERRMKNAGYRSTNTARAAGKEANMIAGRQNQAQSNNSVNMSLRQNITNSRKVLNQGLAYAGAFLVTWFFYIVSITVTVAGGDPKSVIFLLSTFFVPLQGKSPMH